MNRKAARDWLIQTFYQMDLRSEMTEEYFLNCVNQLESMVSEQNKEYLEQVFHKFHEKQSDVDSCLSSHLIDWTLDRISKVDLAILRVAITEILYFKDIPNSVSVKEAVDLSKKYGDEESAGFVNGVLGKIAK